MSAYFHHLGKQTSLGERDKHATCRTPVPPAWQSVVLLEVGSCCECAISRPFEVVTQDIEGSGKRACPGISSGTDLLCDPRVPCLSGSQSLIC